MNIIVSRCLLGESVRWHGKKLYMSNFIKKYIHNNLDIELIPICPELLGGLSVPRNPVKKKNGRIFETCEHKKYRKYITGIERTKEFMKGAKKSLEIAIKNNCRLAILCKWSPSCDKTGITGQLLISNGIEIINTF